MLQQVEGVRFVFPEHRRQHVAPVDHLLLGGKGVNRGALQHPLHPHRLLRFGFHTHRKLLHGLFQKLLQAFLQASDVRSAGIEDGAGLRIPKQRQQQMLESEVLVAHPLRFGDRQSKGRL